MSQERMLLEQLFFFFKVNSLNCSHFTMLSSRDSIKNKANACKCQCLQEQFPPEKLLCLLPCKHTHFGVLLLFLR